MSPDFFNSPAGQILAIVLFVWSLFWKGIALWRAAKSDQQYWFVALLLFNTLGILEIIYLFRFAKKRMTIDELSSYFTNLSVKGSMDKLRKRNKK